MNSELKMSVSSMTRKRDKKGVYVLFTDGPNSAEFLVPDCSVIKSTGFSNDELEQLKDYLHNEQDYIFSLAKDVNPIRGFMK